MKHEKAFPISEEAQRDMRGGFYYPQPGMTLRDYFAAKAMQNLISEYNSLSDVAKNAYGLADLMLKERIDEGD